MVSPRILASILVVFFTFLFSFVFVPQTSAEDELDKLNEEISQLTEALNQSIAATKPLESELDTLTKKVEGIKQQIIFIEQDVAKKEQDIDRGYENLEEKQALLNQTVREYYVKSYYNSPLLMFLSFNSASSITKLLAYQRAQTNQDKAFITNLALSILNLETKSEELKTERSQLASAKSNLDVQAQKLNEVVLGAKAYQKEVSNKISELSAKQQEILNARSGGFTFSIGEGELADEYLSSIAGFRESAPSGSFAVFSFGAYTHRNGMSQYGARGRAENGQSTEEILKAYYPNATLKTDYNMDSITVEGHGSMPFEDQYLQGIYEMPGTWHINALKAQAIAARTYAVRHTNGGQSSICTTEACQVFKNSKKGGAWEQAVNETRGWILVDGGGNPVSTQYASTHGGFSNTGGWDTTDGSGGSNFIDKSYDKLGNSPWLYKAWWRQGYSVSGNTCGRSNPWLTSAEMADLLNAYFVLYGSGGGADSGRVTPVTTGCWGGNPYSHDELRSVSDSYGGGIGSVSGVSVSQGNGTTNEVVFQTDKGEKRINAGNFKTAFNLRAPGYLSIPQSGFAFYNIERK